MAPIPSLKLMAETAANILLTVREKGILNLIVRPHADDNEILAGRRRHKATRVIDAERNNFPLLKSDVRGSINDASALKVSLIENAVPRAH